MARRTKETPDQAVVAAATTIVAADAARQARAAQDPPRPLTPLERRADGVFQLQTMHSKREEAYQAALTAAAMVMDPENAPEGGWPNPNQVTRTWQHQAWGYTRSVPELNAAKLFVGNCLSRCKLVVGKRDPDGSVEQGFDGDEPVEGLDSAIANEAAEHINRLQTPRGGQSEILRLAGERIFVAGEFYIVPEDLPSGLVFEVFSTQELVPDGKGWKKYYGPGWGEEELPEDTSPIRVWRQDGQYQMQATSSVRACLEILEELVVLTRLVRAAAISRMSLAGILVIPDELDTPEGDGTDADGNISEAQNPLIVDIINTGAKAIDDPASAAAWMPYILQGPKEYIDAVKHIPFQTDDSEHVIKRAEAVERLARGLDLPPEKVLGHMGTTYANAGQVSEDNFNLYIEPALQMFCDALTITYLWPAMALARGIDAEHMRDQPWPDDITTVCVTYDARRLISKPDRTKEIIDIYLHDQTFMGVAISEVREAVGLDPSKPPDDEEVAKRIDAYRLGRIREVIQAPPQDAAVPINEATEGHAPIPGQSVGARIAGLPPEQQNEAVQQALLASGVLDPLRFLSVQIASAAELTVDRALERMGARICSKGLRTLTEAQKASISGVSKAAVARILGPEIVGRVLGPNDDPTLAEIDGFTRRVTAWARQAECDDPVNVASEATAVVTTLIRRAIFDEPVPVTPDLFSAALFGPSAALVRT